jgi:hypothetical protein
VKTNFLFGDGKTMHNAIKQGYAAPSVVKQAQVSVATLGVVDLAGEPVAGYQLN